MCFIPGCKPFLSGHILRLRFRVVAGTARFKYSWRCSLSFQWRREEELRTRGMRRALPALFLGVVFFGSLR